MIPVHRTVLSRHLATQGRWLVTPLITITQTRKITFIWPPQNIWSLQKALTARWSRYWSVGILQLVSLVQSCQSSEHTWLLHPSRNSHTFLSVPESSFCCHEHNKGNGYSVKPGTFNQNFSINIYSESLSTKVKCWALIDYCFMLSRTIDSSWKGSTGTEVSIKILVPKPQQC